MNGVINVYKESGMTSFDVVRKIKKIAATGKVGHTGTLDPMATGVLPICIGKATKLVDYIMGDYKVYRAEMKLGLKSDTLDSEGKILSEKPVSCNEEQIRKEFEKFIGEIVQVPPMYSALKVNGKRLYELAREGKEVHRDGRTITIYNIDIESIEIPYVRFKVKCSKGTYIRTLIDDIGEGLGTGAIMTSLERVESGEAFNISNSYTLGEIENSIEDKIISIEDSLKKYPEKRFTKEAKKLLVNGVKIGNPRLIGNVKEGILYRVYVEDLFIGLGLKDSIGFKIEKLFL
ncbi:tRNA pseudouridine(55) synthase TruB [Clostridium bornimense]|uniref:tRNA pseudouridine(55) synthase TruB n=1 Tax=Clostridium bornimense TaxID=1216932 RepID=UPI0005C580F7|nr:tRNA pseudouridine(55) synthase TruB [Clostridium bornimense]